MSYERQIPGGVCVSESDTFEHQITTEPFLLSETFSGSGDLSIGMVGPFPVSFPVRYN